MKRWLRRFGYLLIVIIWLMIMCFPTFAFALATNGQIQLGSNPRNQLRFFLVQEEEADGIGVEWSRPLLGKTCSKTTVTYFLWEGSSQGQNVSYCQCFDPDSGVPLPIDENNCG